MKYFKAIKSELEDSKQEWADLLKSDYWKFPPNWTWVSDEEITFWGKIRNLPSKIYEFLVVRITYEEYFASQLRSRYMDIEGNFRTTFRTQTQNNQNKPQNNQNKSQNDSNFEESSDFIKELLILSKGILEQKKFSKKDLLTASSLLDEAEERMIWILPHDVKSAKVNELNYQLDNLDQGHKDECKKIIANCTSNQQGAPNENENQHNAELEEIIRVINKNTLSKRINTGLQIERLRSLRFWGLILLIVFIFLFPITSNVSEWGPAKELIQFWGDSPDSINDSVNLTTFLTNLTTGLTNLTKDSAKLKNDSSNLTIGLANLAKDSANLKNNSSNLTSDLANLTKDSGNLKNDSVILTRSLANLTNGSVISNINSNSKSRLRDWLEEWLGPLPTKTFAGWALALGFSIIGAIGGFLSGLLQVRTSETNLELYEEAVLLFQIRPIFGALAALIVYVLMAWGAFKDMIPPSSGNIVFAAFLSGFSERYFLQLMQNEPQSEKQKEQ